MFVKMMGWDGAVEGKCIQTAGKIERNVRPTD